jgi:hypothetical protein
VSEDEVENSIANELSNKQRKSATYQNSWIVCILLQKGGDVFREILGLSDLVTLLELTFWPGSRGWRRIHLISVQSLPNLPNSCLSPFNLSQLPNKILLAGSRERRFGRAVRCFSLESIAQA